MKPDLQLKHDVAAELEFQPSVNAAAIGVEVSDGVVTLSGHVDSHAEKWYAETAAQRVEGVKGLVINLNVELPAAFRRYRRRRVHSIAVATAQEHRSVASSCRPNTLAT